MSLYQSPHTNTNNRSRRSIFTLPAHLHLSLLFDCVPPYRPIKFLQNLLYLPNEGSIEPKTLPWFPTWKVLQMIGIALSVQWLGCGREWGAGIRFSTGTDFSFHRSIQTVLGLCLLTETRFSPPGLERPWYEADHSLVSRPEVKNAWSRTSNPAYVLMTWCLIRQRDNSTFNRNENLREMRKSTSPPPSICKTQPLDDNVEGRWKGEHDAYSSCADRTLTKSKMSEREPRISMVIRNVKINFGSSILSRVWIWRTFENKKL